MCVTMQDEKNQILVTNAWLDQVRLHARLLSTDSVSLISMSILAAFFVAELATSKGVSDYCVLISS